jgi:RNA polymerase I-specific transcription initiation factor RRN5
MEAEDINLPERRGPQLEEDDDSGSAYEAPSSGEEDSSHDENAARSRSSRTNSLKGRGRSRSRSRSRKTAVQSEDRNGLYAQTEGPSSSGKGSSINQYREDQTQEEALQWAVDFQEPQNPEDIRSPSRRPAGSHSKKRKAEKPASEIRSRRLKGFYSNDYRELLNVDIRDAGSKLVRAGQTPLEGSQIGSSIWTSKEKELFFSALSRLGRDDVLGMAAQIGSKSELEVHEYIHLLHQGMTEKRLYYQRGLLYPTDFPTAFEISEECCSLLERAGDALASRQERSEEKVEQTKWGDTWLLTGDVSRWLDKQRKEEGEQGIEKVLPSANLLNLKNWLELSHRIFMNPAAPREEDNWQMLAEPGETPAIRATAFADFHSLTVNITKRLISTTLFCTMSRQRAMASKKVKHAEVNPGDVEAAVKILGLKSNSKDIWIACIRRCNLNIIDDDDALKTGDGISMTYDEAEGALGGRIHYPSRTQSASRNEYTGTSAGGTGDEAEGAISPLSSDLDLEDGGLGVYTSEYPSSDELDDQDHLGISNGESTNLDSRQERIARRIGARNANERAQERYTETFDAEADRMEEEQLWALLRQSAPFDVKIEPLEQVERPKNVRDAMGEPADWRNNLEYWSQWETLSTPAPEEEFVRNRRKLRRPRREISSATAEHYLANSPEGMDGHERLLLDDSEGDKNEEYASAEDGHDQGDGKNVRSEFSGTDVLSISPQSAVSEALQSGYDGASDNDINNKSKIN